ncbi:helix-turn-helix transcriptional regulator [Sphingobacterium sp. DR205]|uniref:helix-turn-helix domain-containing protein n=1 Tax=Sphingobacterium sp. DR205 TaxID=2713573 RepID=UPI0013E4FC10|nr:helix-turn-helix transcriptional regulator [Sphingobacterium sp. DR205]QIH31632.1 helix-turn-helix domain-containing protein [Sphingobacterium sp. DR205]
MAEHLDSTDFKDKLERILIEENKHNELSNVKDRIDSIIGDRKFVTGRVFYTVAQIVNIEIESLCNKVFNDNKFNLVIDFSKAKTKLQAFIMIYANSNNHISRASGIEKSRFSRLQNGEVQEIYADEVYALAKSFNISPSLLFEYLYGENKELLLKLQLIDPTKEK